MNRTVLERFKYLLLFDIYTTHFMVYKNTTEQSLFLLNSAVCGLTQGCPQDVKSQDRDETETFQKMSRDRLETETFKTETNIPGTLTYIK